MSNHLELKHGIDSAGGGLDFVTKTINGRVDSASSRWGRLGGLMDHTKKALNFPTRDDSIDEPLALAIKQQMQEYLKPGTEEHRMVWRELEKLLYSNTCALDSSGQTSVVMGTTDAVQEYYGAYDKVGFEAMIKGGLDEDCPDAVAALIEEHGDGLPPYNDPNDRSKILVAKGGMLFSVPEASVTMPLNDDGEPITKQWRFTGAEGVVCITDGSRRLRFTANRLKSYAKSRRVDNPDDLGVIVQCLETEF